MKVKSYPRSERVDSFDDHGYCAFRAYAYICDKYNNDQITPFKIAYRNGYKEFPWDWDEFFKENNISEEESDEPHVLEWSDEIYHYEFQSHVCAWVKSCLTRFSGVEWEVEDLRSESEELETVANEHKDKFFVALVQCPELAKYDPYLWHINVIDKNVCYEKMDSDHVDTYKSVDFIFFPH